MKIKPLIFIISLSISAISCSKDYTPEQNVSGEHMFHTACAGCHQKDTAGKIFKWDNSKANVAHIQDMLTNGNMMMPKFPNIKGEALDKLTTYVLENSVVE